MRFETRDIQNRIKTMKIRRKSKSENDYVFLNIFATMSHKKNSTF